MPTLAVRSLDCDHGHMADTPALVVEISPSKPTPQVGGFMREADKSEPLIENAIDSLGALGRAVAEASAPFTEALQQAGASSVELSLGLRLQAKGQWVVGNGGQTTAKVKVVWSKEE